MRRNSLSGFRYLLVFSCEKKFKIEFHITVSNLLTQCHDTASIWRFSKNKLFFKASYVFGEARVEAMHVSIVKKIIRSMNIFFYPIRWLHHTNYYSEQ